MALDKKLNIGVSEYNSIPDFLNIGIEFTHKGIIEKDGKRMLRHDVTQPFPISDESVEFIYASHIVEHLSIEDFHFFLKECYRILHSGGVLRIVCPDLQKWISAYINKDKSFFNRYRDILKQNIGRPWNTISTDLMFTDTDIFVNSLHNWNHKWAFDFESIRSHLASCGFDNIINTSYRNSAYDDIGTIEPEFHKLESLYVEVKK